jgi:hypothetical protein
VIFRLKSVDGRPENLDLGIALFRDVVSHCCTSVEGFSAGYFLVDRESGKTVTLTVWNDREALAQGRRNLVDALEADAQAADTVKRINSQGVRFDTYEVAHEISPSEAAH